MQTILPEVQPLRHAARGMVRELGFLQGTLAGGAVTHAECHALIELGLRGTVPVGELAEALRLDKSTVSRTVTNLAKRRLVEPVGDRHDARKKLVRITKEGRRTLARIDGQASRRVHDALSLLSEADRRVVTRGLELYAGALARSRRRLELTMRPIEPRDDPQVARLIRTVMPEFGASGPGFAILDPEVDAMCATYRRPRSAYFVVERGGRVVGGGGYAPLEGGDAGTCELRKMYFLGDVRGLGMGEHLLDRILDEAAARGFERCYLETLASMKAARKLYERKGFARLDAPRGATGHHGCNAWYEMALPR